MAEWLSIDECAKTEYLTIEKDNLLDKYFFRGPYKTLSGAKKHMAESKLESVVIVKYGLFKAYISYDEWFLPDEDRGPQNRFEKFINRPERSTLDDLFVVENYLNQDDE